VNEPDPRRLARLYDRIARVYDWSTFFEGRAKAAALAALAPRRGERVLNAGAGTGRVHADIVRRVEAAGLAVGLDLSRRMLGVARRRGRAPYVQASLLHPPFAAAAFDAVYCTYVLDLLEAPMLPKALRAFWELLKPGGRAVLLTLTEGISPAGKLTMSLWKGVYRLAPLACGGCRPLQLAQTARQAGFRIRRDETIEELGMPSNLLVLEKPQ